jgi:hypothetical protein
MPTTPDWRSSADDAALNQLERPGFAWEFLRRNQEYRVGYERIIGLQSENMPEVANAAADFARRWGLVFRPGPSAQRRPNRDILAA